MDYLFYLRGWIGMVAFMAFGNSVQCFTNHSFLSTRLYTGAPSLVNGLSARLFGVWTLLAAALRLYCAFDIRNKSIYNLTLFSFLLALIYFLLETFVYETSRITVGVIAPLLVSGISMVAMLIGYSYLDEPLENYTKIK